MTYQVHPEADRFPMLSDERLAEFAEDIRTNGLHRPVTLWNGTVLDGRNRLKACELAGVEPRFDEFHGDEVAATRFVYSVNLQSRDLSTTQRATLVAQREKAVEAARQRGAANQGERTDLSADRHKSIEPFDATTELAKEAGVSRRTMARTLRVQKEDPETFKQMAAGKVSVTAADSAITHRKRVRRNEHKLAAEARKFMEEERAHRAAEVAARKARGEQPTGYMSAADANRQIDEALHPDTPAGNAARKAEKLLLQAMSENGPAAVAFFEKARDLFREHDLNLMVSGNE